MTKKDYIAIANAINEGYAEAIKSNDTMTPKSITAICIVDKLCEVFIKDNPRFNAEKFKNAAYVE